MIITLLVWEFGYGDKELVKEPSENKSGGVRTESLQKLSSITWNCQGFALADYVWFLQPRLWLIGIITCPR